MAHHHHSHESSLPKLPKLASQVLFVVVVGLLAAVSIFVYKKLIPLGDYVNQQEDIRQLTNMCESDINNRKEGMAEGISEEDCSCLAETLVKESGDELSQWMDDAKKEERLARYVVLLDSCR